MKLLPFHKAIGHLPLAIRKRLYELTNAKRLKPKGAFTLIELLVVISIIAILVSAATVSYVQVQKKARNSQRAAHLHLIGTALERFYADHGFYPSTRSTDVTGSSWENASASANGDHTNCLLGGASNTGFIPPLTFWDWCGMNPANSYPGAVTIPASNKSNLPANVYIANGTFASFPKDPAFAGVAGEAEYAYASGGQTYALATRHYEGQAPLENRLVSGGEYFSATAPAAWSAQLKDGNQYVVRSPNHK